VTITEVNRKYGDWAGGLRERLNALGKENQYVGMQRMPSHAGHGTWVELLGNHLNHDSQSDVFSPDPTFSWVDARSLGPIAMVVLEATEPYLERFFAGIPETQLLLDRLDDLWNRIYDTDAAHERLMT
jgi:hypothetical protein